MMSYVGDIIADMGVDVITTPLLVNILVTFY